MAASFQFSIRIRVISWQYLNKYVIIIFMIEHNVTNTAGLYTATSVSVCVHYVHHI